MTANSLHAKEIFGRAIEIAVPEERSAYLDQACSDNNDLRAEVDQLLAAVQAAGSFIERPLLQQTEVRETSSAVGTQIGPYKLQQQIGEGGMGTVYMAEQTEPVERRVALKIIKPGMDTRQVIARFEAERQALAMMDHPNIAKVLDAGATDSGRPYFVMELVNGIPVTKFCDEQHLTARERLELFIPICQAVQHAHQKGIIHRDIKPSNILVALYDGRPVPKVIDFGVAKATGGQLTEMTVFTRVGQIVGTIEYMSPEQAERNQLDIDTRSDVYSLGVVLYELLTGETPFDKQRLRTEAIDELLRIIREEEPPKPSTRLSSSETLPSVAANRKIEPAKLSALVRGELDWIVMKALEKDRSRRYDTASKFAEDIQHYLNDEAVVACPPSAGYRFRKFARRNKAAMVTTITVVLAVIVGTSIATWQAIEATQQRDRAFTAEGLAQSRLESEQQARAAEAEQRREADDARREAEAQRAQAFEQRDRAVNAEQLAVEQQQIAQREELTARRQLYRSQINLIDQAIERGETGRAQVLLESQRPRDNQPDLRGFEWYCLWRQCHQGHLLTLRGHEQSVHSVAFSPDSRTLASASPDGTVRLWDRRTGQQAAMLQDHGQPCRTVAFSPDGTLLASAGDDGVIRIWELATGQQRANWQGHPETIYCLAFSPDGNTLATGSKDHTVRLWDVTSGSERFRLSGATEKLIGTKVSPILSLAFNSDGTALAAGGTGWGNLKIWDVTTGEQRFQLRGHVLDVYAVAFSPDGQTLASGGQDQTVRLWDVTTGTLKATLAEQRDRVFALTFSPDGALLATGTRDGTATLWDVGTQEKRLNLFGHRALIRSITFSPDGRTLASAGDDRSIKLWDTTVSESPTIVPGGTGIVWSLAFSPDRSDLAFSLDSVVIWNLVAGNVRPSKWPEIALGLAYTPDGKTLAAAGEMGLGLLDLTTGSETAVSPSSQWGVAFSPDGKLLASGRDDYSIRLWELANMQVRTTLHGHTDWVCGLSFSPDGNMLASASLDQTVKLWDIATGRERATLRGHPGNVWSVAFLPDGKTLISSGGDIRVWDVDTASERLTLVRDDGSRKGQFVALSPDGRTLVSASPEDLTFWNATTWQEQATFQWHKALIRAMAFSPDSRMLATGGMDGTVTLWRAATEADVVAQSSWP